MLVEFGSFASTLPSGKTYALIALSYDVGNAVASEGNPVRPASVSVSLIDQDGALKRDIASQGNAKTLNFTASHRGMTITGTNFALADWLLGSPNTTTQGPNNGFPGTAINLSGDPEKLNISTEN